MARRMDWQDMSKGQKIKAVLTEKHGKEPDENTVNTYLEKVPEGSYSGRGVLEKAISRIKG